jgi:hypothetical protein
MLMLRHRFAPPTLGARFAQDELRSDELVVCRTRFRRGRFDEVPGLPSGRRASWAKVRFVLRGHLVARTREGRHEVLAPGDLAVSARWDDWRCQALTDDSEYLLVGWRHDGQHGARPPPSEIVRAEQRTSAVSPIARAYALAAALDEGGDARVLGAATALVHALGRAGIPLAPDAVRAAGQGIPARDRVFARVMESAFFPLAARPMAVDLGGLLGVGDRHAMRRANEFLLRYYVTAIGWREYVRGMRLELGVFLSGVRGATTSDVSRALGFSTPTTLCHAFAAAGLGSPRAVGRRLLRGDPRAA